MVARHLVGWDVGVSSRNETFSLVLRQHEDPAVEVNLVDCGTGLVQVLPIVVQRCFEAVNGTSGGLEIVEQPELHLHPAACGDVADLYIDATKETGTRFIIETHSETFLLRIRRRIAEGKLDPSHVVIYWISETPGSGSRIETIRVNQNGEMDNWPQGVFSEDFEELKAIRRAVAARIEPS